MAVVALLPSAGALPEPAILVLLEGIQEVLANDISLGHAPLSLSVLLFHHFSQLSLVPVLHCIRITNIGVNIPLLCFPLDGNVV
uniref:Uncharacterized protein n=1 Tax=Ixodes ricinus TaxID=34613 RepID=A0A6B0U9Q4_IXORI